MATWSHSRIETFRSCPRKFFYAYIRKVRLPEQPESLAQFFGKRVHEALEWLYGEVRRGRVPDERALGGTLERRWREEWHESVMLPDDVTPSGHLALAMSWLCDYHRRHAPFAMPRTIALERRIVFPLDDDGRYRMQGFVDRIARSDDGTWQVHDYKTNRTLPTQEDKDRDPQLAYYQIGLRRLWPQAERVELVWHFLAFDTAITSHRDPEQLDAARAGALVTISDIESREEREEAFPTNESRLCDYCPFQQVCPVRKHRFTVALLPPSRHASESGVTLVNAWVELEGRRRELKAQAEAIEAEIEEVRAAIEVYATREGLEVVTGEGREATVKRSEKVIFPRKSYDGEAEEAAALEAQLRASPHWNDVSDVNRAALTRLWSQRATLEQDLRALLEEFARTETQVDVRLRLPRS